MPAQITRHWHPVLAASELGTKPVSVQIHHARLVLWRGPGGVPAAVYDKCPHREAPLSLGRVRPDGRLACGYHGWNFDAAGIGASPASPDLRHCDVRSYQVVERHGYLWVADRDVPESELPELSFDGFELAGAFTTRFPVPLHIALDNFTEDEHFPYVHRFLGWDEAHVGEVVYEAFNFDDHTEATYVGPQRPAPFLPLIGVKAGDHFHNHFCSRFGPVYTVYSSHWTDPATGRRRPIAAKTVPFMVPQGDRETLYHTFVFVGIDPSSLFASLRPVVRQVARRFVSYEWERDAAWVARLADTATELKGLRLGRFDKTVIRNRKLLRTLYFGEAEGPSASG
jgi:phenylpropionate dioxygenase-like ring-hydroxylating dioxygenase large terminal subunit